MNNNSSKKIPFKQMCETIVESNILVRSDGVKPTAKEIFEYSSRGELFMIFEWYRKAVTVLNDNKTSEG